MLATSGSALALGGCASLAATTPRPDTSALAERPTLLVATTRKPNRDPRANPWFGSERSSTLNVARVRLAPPSDSVLAIGSDWSIADVEPVAGTRIADLIGPELGPREVLLYVHGFRHTFESATLEAVHLSDGIRFRGETMAFAWPSKAGLFDYVYDRESAMYSRDAFERVLDALIRNRNVGRIHIVAHSMGTMLTLESLRQLHARYGYAQVATEKVATIVLAAPDIDLDVFSSSVERIGPLRTRITVVTATNDRALALSQKLAGGITRVGAAEKAQLESLGLRVIDASGIGWGFINHDLFLSNAEVRRVVREAIDGAPGFRA